MKSKVYLGLTTTGNSSWHEKIKEIKKLGIDQVALFPTSLKPDERQKLYRELEKTSISYIPFVHLRHDSTEEEIKYFRSRYKTKYFNIHADPKATTALKNQPDHQKIIFIENTDRLQGDFFTSIKDFAGICLDFSHWEDYGEKQKDKSYESFEEIVKANRVEFCHISSVKKTPYFRHYSYYSFHDKHFSAHKLERLSDLDYLRKYRKYFPKIMGIEIENSFSKQLEVKRYLEEEIIL